ncbi:hypothetical protein NUU61_006159 [Penicillium alfredii]|uniref:Uncharacterized protein n=1 Tax=Penicillium alfredii TaxID=1506179 RepID=A0A9W9K322_9EURO|nr:uncharacterized protein NUU61_006159 [Penicillium alfredii]KAJ5091289.1 hypothetical protein NUU61_006159 [Penicillium alfredii]
MTATSSLAFPAMEVPAVDDSMEMASPYQGQADDFDIDIDLMEDHVSNMDSDMMGADDYLNTSQADGLQNDAINDADMADEPSEGSMVDADNYADEDNDIDVEYEEETYEAEMLEGDQDQHVEHAIPTIQLEAPAHIENEPTPPSLDTTVTAEKSSEGPEQDPANLAEMTHAESGTQASEHPDQDIHPEPSKTEEGLERSSDENEATEAVLGQENLEVGGETNTAVDVDDDHAQPDPPIASPKASNARLSNDETKQVEQLEPQNEQEKVGQDAREDESLHPVKVIYQENEIALFPPLEGDSAETFFLHDEDVAYDHLGRLFKALREVLQGNVAENEVLVIDIDSLGIQMTEDSSYTSKVTLHQVLDLYLRLCHNDGTDGPEPLYITLSSKLTVPAEIADLLAAANEGKGLSQVHSWDDYEEADPTSEEALAFSEPEQQGEESHADGTGQDQSIHEVDETVLATQEQEVANDESYSKTHEANVPKETGPLQDGENAIVEGHEAEDAAETETAALHREERETDHQAEEYGHLDEEEHLHEEVAEDFYDSEGQKTESTATVAPMSEPAQAQETTEDLSANITEGGPAQHDTADTHDQVPDGDALEAGHYPEADSNDGLHNEPEEVQDDLIGDEHGDAGVQNDNRLGGSASAQVEETLDEPDTAPQAGDPAIEGLQDDVDQSSHGQDKSALDFVAQEPYALKEQTPEPTDDLLGIAEDLMQTPAKDELEDTGSLNEEHQPEHEYGYPAAADDDGTDKNLFDEGDYGHGHPDFDVTEAVELDDTKASSHPDSQTRDTGSAKRSRAVEEDWETGETTPDTKRRRPS